jgi:hypothetical protein
MQFIFGDGEIIGRSVSRNSEVVENVKNEKNCTKKGFKW